MSRYIENFIYLKNWIIKHHFHTFNLLRFFFVSSHLNKNCFLSPELED